MPDRYAELCRSLEVVTTNFSVSLRADVADMEKMWLSTGPTTPSLLQYMHGLEKCMVIGQKNYRLPRVDKKMLSLFI
jgi:hypothetical protein